MGTALALGSLILPSAWNGPVLSILFAACDGQIGADLDSDCKFALREGVGNVFLHASCLCVPLPQVIGLCC